MVLDDAKHQWIDRDEIDKLLAKGKGWLARHPEKTLIARRALKHRRALADIALARLAESVESEAEDEEAAPREEPEAALEKPIRLHDLRLDTVAGVLREQGARRVLDLGCSEGQLLKRLVRERGSHLHLSYTGVVKFFSLADLENGLIGPHGYGDLGYDEIDVTDDGLFEHRLLFSTGIEIPIVFGNFHLGQ